MSLKTTLLALFITAALSAQTFQMHYGGFRDEAIYGMNPCTDGGFIFVGSSETTSIGAEDALLIRTDAAGQMQWSRAYGGAQTENAFFAKQMPDGGFAVCGETFSNGQNGEAFLLRTDASGNLSWFKTFGDAGYDIAYSFAPTNNGGYIIAGLTERNSAFNYEAFLICADTNGDTLWTKTYGGASIDHAVSVIQTSDQGFIFSGKCMSFGAGISDVWLLKTDSIGTVQWTTVSGGAGWDEDMSVMETANGYVVCGGTNSSGAGDYDFLLMQYDFNGNRIWAKTYGGNRVEASYTVRQTADGGFAFAGYTETFGPGHNQRLSNPNLPHVLGTDSANMMLIKTNATGDTSWTQTYGGLSKEECFGMVVLNDGYVLAGYTSSFGDSLQAILIRTDSSGNSGCNNRPAHPQIANAAFNDAFPTCIIGAGFTCAQLNYTNAIGNLTQTVLCENPLSINEENFLNFTCFPIPTADALTISVSPETLSSIELYELSGRLCLQQKTDALTTITIQTALLSKGIYIMHLRLGNGKLLVRKIEII
jgi:hypothetical protein